MLDFWRPCIRAQTTPHPPGRAWRARFCRLRDLDRKSICHQRDGSPFHPACVERGLLCAANRAFTCDHGVADVAADCYETLGQAEGAQFSSRTIKHARAPSFLSARSRHPFYSFLTRRRSLRLRAARPIKARRRSASSATSPSASRRVTRRCRQRRSSASRSRRSRRSAGSTSSTSAARASAARARFASTASGRAPASQRCRTCQRARRLRCTCAAL